jgi:hypothetical protein
MWDTEGGDLLSRDGYRLGERPALGEGGREIVYNRQNGDKERDDGIIGCERSPGRR